MPGRTSLVQSILMAALLAAAAPIGAAADEGGSADGLFDASTKKAVLFYQNSLFDRPTGVYEDGGWTYFQTRVPFDKTAKGRQAAQQAARLAHDRLILRWMIDHALEKKGVDAVVSLSPGAATVRKLVRAEEPAWEFDSAEVPPVSLQQLADQAEDGVFVLASGGETEKLLAAVPENLGAPWPTAKWASAAKDAVRLRYRANPEAFLSEAGALDLLSIRKNDCEGTFPSVEADSFPQDVENFVKVNAVVSGDSASEEMEAFSDALARYASKSPEARRFRDRALALQRAVPVERTVFSSPVVVEETNRVSTVVTNWFDRAQVVSNRTVRSLAVGQTLRGAVPYSANVFVARESEPAFSVTTNETITISRCSEVRAERVRVSETGRPQFERLFLSAGTLSNSPAPQTERGAAAVSLFSKKGATAAQREAALLDALGENPGDKALWNYLGRLFQAREDWLGAAICFRNALRIDPEFDYALTNLADCHKALGNVNLSVGTAVLARGLATNEWCEKRAAAILETPRDAFEKK